jgi:hypothetical protein
LAEREREGERERGGERLGVLHGRCEEFNRGSYEFLLCFDPVPWPDFERRRRVAVHCCAGVALVC